MACGEPLEASAPGPGNLTGLLLQDQLLKQRYRILAQIGRGGFAAVYKAEDLHFGSRLVAVKEMSQSGLSQKELAEAIEAFEREAHLLARLQYPNLPRIYDHFSERGRWYFVMDFIEGETLGEYLLHQGAHRLSLNETLAIGLQLCSVLDYLHTRRPPIISAISSQPIF
jgi:serine/threonine protein kinase